MREKNPGANQIRQKLLKKSNNWANQYRKSRKKSDRTNLGS